MHLLKNGWYWLIKGINVVALLIEQRWIIIMTSLAWRSSSKHFTKLDFFFSVSLVEHSSRIVRIQKVSQTNRGKVTIYSLRLRDSRDSQDSGTPKTPGLPEDWWKKWKQPVASFTALQTIFKFRFKPKNVSWGFLSSSQEDDPHQPWRASPHFRHLLPCVESWWTGHPDHLNRGWTAQSQSGHPAGLTISSLPWCTSPSPCATDRLVLFSFLYFCTRPLWSKELSPTPPPSPPRASSEGTLQCKSCSIPGFPGSWQGWHCISAMFSATPPTTINCVNMVDQVCGKKSQYSALLLPAWWQGRQRGKHQRKWGQTWRCIITIPLLITTIHNSNASSTEASHGLHWVLEHLGGHPHQQCRFTQMSRGHLHWRLLEESRYGEMFSLRPGSPSQLKSLTYVLLNALVWPGFIIGLTFPRSLRCWTTTTR